MQLDAHVWQRDQASSELLTNKETREYGRKKCTACMARGTHTCLPKDIYDAEQTKGTMQNRQREQSVLLCMSVDKRPFVISWKPLL